MSFGFVVRDRGLGGGSVAAGVILKRWSAHFYVFAAGCF
jgi:hypothetical protein